MIRTQSNTMTFEDWSARLAEAALRQRKSQWDIGDLVLEGGAFEDSFNDICDRIGLEYQTLANCKSVAKAFPIEHRNLNVGWSIHQALVSFCPGNLHVAKSFLSGAEKHGWTREVVRKRVTAWKGGDLDAVNPDWKGIQNSTEIDEASFTAGGKDDSPVFDGGDFSEGMEAERSEKLDAYAEQDLNDANQVLMSALSAVEKATALSNLRLLNHDRVDWSRVRAAAVALQSILPKNSVSGRCEPEAGRVEPTVNQPHAPTISEPEIPSFLDRRAAQ